MSKSLTFAVDFDGTCVTHSYPDIGKDIGAVPVLKDLIANGHRLVLFTMRSDETLDQAVQWFKDNDIELFGINRNPTQDSWTNSPKAYANMYIDDAAVGAPLLMDEKMGKRPYMNWRQVRLIFEEHGFIEKGSVKMHKALADIIKAHGLEDEGWEHQGDGESYAAEGADGTIYATLIQFSYNDDGYRVQFDHHYGHQLEYDWEGVSVNYGEVSEEVKEWF